MVSYEAALGLSLLCVLLNSGALSTNAIVSQQSTWNWNLWTTGLVPFVVFLIASTAEMNRPPFDLVEAEQELVGGFHTEYSSIRFALFFLAEFMNVITMSAVIVTLFLGGPIGPNFGSTGWVAEYVLPFMWFFLKVVVLLVVFVLVPHDAAPPPLRPADGPRLEAPDPAGAGLVPVAGRAQGRRRRGLEPACSPEPIGVRR